MGVATCIIYEGIVSIESRGQLRMLLYPAETRIYYRKGQAEASPGPSQL